MKKFKFIIACASNRIKNYFFNIQKDDISQDCGNLFGLSDDTANQEELKCAKEYAENYKVTTRWQTL